MTREASLASAPSGRADERAVIRRINHTIHAVEDIHACRACYQDMLGGLVFAEGYFEPEDRDMALLYVTDHMVEPMAPRRADDLTKPFARYLERYGQGFHSIEFKVDDGRATGERLKAAGCKLASDYGFFFFVRPESTGGVLLEVCDVLMPNDPYDRRNWRPDWSEGMASTLLRLDHIACVTAQLETAVDFFTTHFDGDVLEDARTELPQGGRRVLLRLGDAKVSFVQPDEPGSGALGAFLSPPTSGVYALVWSVEDENKAQGFFRGKGLRVTREGCISRGFAIDPRDFHGARHEFVAAR